MDLSQVSRTAILLLICRAIEAEKNKYGKIFFACTPELIGVLMCHGFLVLRIHMISKLMEKVSKLLVKKKGQ